MKQAIKLGVTDRTFLVFIPDSASTVGKGKTGLVAASLTVSYARVETDNDVTVTDVTSSLNNLSTLTDAHNDWGLLEVSATLAAGLYRLDVADAVFASGAWSAVVYVCVTSGLAAASPMEFILVAYDQLDGVRMGLTALPNAAAEAAGGLYTRGTGAGQINQASNGQVDVNVDTIKTNPVVNGGTITFPTTATLASTTNITAGTVTTVSGNVNGSVGSVTGLTASNLDATVSSRLATSGYTAPPSAASIAAAVWAVVIFGSTTAIQLMRGFAAALLGKASGLGTTNVKYRDPDDSKDVIDATVDADGNRTAITLDLT